jgi:hypothetical protein
VTGVGKDVKLNLLIELLEISGISIVVVGFRDNGLETRGVIIGLSASGCSRIVGGCGYCSYCGMGGLYWGFCVSWVLGSNRFL